ncbi:hypothetical protein [Streptomyces sp. C8S0]|uniref:hypothetical protein n=1 Tax=Streptomyces sp. C8S0 TaxID=2585716 RepID=UPI001D037416|nr:hypothetical protein [Streptomyces sp. C8S0]
MVATGRMHGFESLAERRLLLALDFLGGVEEVLSQPFKFRFTTGDGSEDHTPDFLVLLRGLRCWSTSGPATWSRTRIW